LFIAGTTFIIIIFHSLIKNINQSIKLSVSTVSSSEDVVEAGSLTKQQCMPNRTHKRRSAKRIKNGIVPLTRVAVREDKKNYGGKR
jgi:uncharacterized protein (UPF0333 family)